MNAENLAKLLKTSFTKGMKVLVKGKPGIGKSDIVAQVCKELGYRLQISHPAISDPTDYKGMPAMRTDGTAAFVPFGDLNMLIQATEPLVCFLDDIGQANPSVQAALMQLVLARRVNGHALSDKVVFCGATNDIGHMAGVGGMIEPLKSRWDAIVELECSLDAWCLWAYDHAIPAELIGYLRSSPQSLSAFKPTKELKNSPSPRGWASVGRWLSMGVKDIEVFSGAVGEAESTKFFGFLDIVGQLPSLDQIIIDPVNTPVPDKPACRYFVSSGLSRLANITNLDRVITYLTRMPKEFEVSCMKDAVRLGKNNVTACKAFVEWCVKHKDVIG